MYFKTFHMIQRNSKSAQEQQELYLCQPLCSFSRQLKNQALDKREKIDLMNSATFTAVGNFYI